jgi:hypothetical protein
LYYQFSPGLLMAEELRAARGIELTGRAAPGGLAIRERREATGDTGQKTRTIRVRGVIVGEILAPRGFGCIRSRRIAEEATVEVFPFIEEVVGPGAVVRPDGGPICSMSGEARQHERFPVRSVMPGSVPAHVPLLSV